MMDKKMMKMAALEEMAGKSSDSMKPHMAECPKCGHRWVMGEDEYNNEEDSEEGYED